MIYLFLANGFEEIEALAVVDILRRAGKSVQTVGIGGKTIMGSHNIPVSCDCDEDDILFDELLEMIILPGGKQGTENLEESSTVQDAISFCAEKKLWIGAICAAPSILAHRGLLEGVESTCYPAFEEQLIAGGARLLHKRTVVCENYITSRGAGTAVNFALTIVGQLCTEKLAAELAEKIVCTDW